MGDLACKAFEDPQRFACLSTRFRSSILLLLGQYRCWIVENIVATVTGYISEVICEYWQVLGFVVCIGMYGGMYCGTYWYVLTWYVLWHVLVCIVFGI